MQKQGMSTHKLIRIVTLAPVLAAVSLTLLRFAPQGVYRGAGDYLLALLWLTELLYPEQFDIDLAAGTKQFYQTFFDFELDDDTIAAVLSGDGMRTPKTQSPGE